MKNQQHYVKGILLICAASLSWSSAGLFIKIVDLPPFHIALGRSLIAGLFLAIYAMWAQRGTDFKLPFNRWTLWTALCYTFTVTLFVASNKLTTSANAVFLQYAAPVYVILISYFFLREKIYFAEIVTVTVCLAGMTLFFLEEEKSTALVGNLFGIASGIAFAMLLVVVKRSEVAGSDSTHSDLYGIYNLAIGNFLNVIILVAAIALFHAGNVENAFLTGLIGKNVEYTNHDILGLLFLGVFQLGLGYLFFAKGAKYISSVEIAIYTLLEPVCNPVWTFLGTGETPGFWAVIGGLLVLSAITFNALARKKPST